MIEGVGIKALKLIRDDRGFLMEMLRCDEAMFEAFGQVYLTGCLAGVAKAWHYHKEQTDHFVCVAGKALVVLYDMREDSRTRGIAQEFILAAPPGGEQTPILVKVPPMVVHGFTVAEGEEAQIINIPTRPYRYANPDECRLPWNSEAIPYRWPAHITRGG
jgi:dTDP-4-dehydrorhamnose 3,5-epimerase